MRSVRLLERDSSLASLREYAEDARRGAGRLVLVAGEAGVGKTALLECLEEQLTAADWAWGGCDGLSTPRPLGPLFDIAARIAGDLLAACQAAAPRETLFQSRLRQVDGTGRPAVLVIEDAHWADEATLDLVRFLGRRIRDTHVLLVVTYRDDGLRPDDPLRVVIGELASHRSTRRIGLAPLSEPAVRELAAASRLEPAMIYELTGGNPFYVTELLRSGAADPGSALPGSAHDAVMARVAALDADARRLLDVAALAGARVEPWVLRAISDDAERGIDACLASGVMTQDASGLRFRHELARLAVADAVPVHRRPDLHRGLLDCLRQGGCEDDARLAHHAEGAGDATAVRGRLPGSPRTARRSPSTSARCGSPTARRRPSLRRSTTDSARRRPSSTGGRRPPTRCTPHCPCGGRPARAPVRATACAACPRRSTGCAAAPRPSRPLSGHWPCSSRSRRVASWPGPTPTWPAT
jgi:hypothetical protein